MLMSLKCNSKCQIVIPINSQYLAKWPLDNHHLVKWSQIVLNNKLQLFHFNLASDKTQTIPTILNHNHKLLDGATIFLTNHQMIKTTSFPPIFLTQTNNLKHIYYYNAWVFRWSKQFRVLKNPFIGS